MRPSIRLSALLACAASIAPAQEAADSVLLNQVGYLTGAPKIALVSGAAGDSFAIVAADRPDTLFRGRLSAPSRWEPAQRAVRAADFSAFGMPGSWRIAVAGLRGSSLPFAISDTALLPLSRASLQAFYLRRASTAIPQRFGGAWARVGGHPDTSVLVHPSAASAGRPAGTRFRAPGGWYDAGDYGKYIVNSGITTWTLLLAYEHYSAYFDRLVLDIPESGDAVPDILDETLWNLRWMLSMQDPGDSGVYHKMSTANWASMTARPDQDTAARWAVMKTTAATLDFAATAARASTILRLHGRSFSGLADSCLRAAQGSWNWARRNPEVLWDNNRVSDPKIKSGFYEDQHVGDEFLWAGVELWNATAADSFLAAAHASAGWRDAQGHPTWANVAALGIFALVDARDRLGAFPGLRDSAKARLLHLADSLLARTRSGFRVTAERENFVWGSNSEIANQALVLLQAWRLTRDTAYLAGAAQDVDYLLGRNAVGQSFVTGFGARPLLHPHDRLSESDTLAAPVPGWLSGGPNAGIQDRDSTCLPRYLDKSIAARAWTDHACSYATNEIAINWNAPLAYLVGALQAEHAAWRTVLGATPAPPATPFPASAVPPLAKAVAGPPAPATAAAPAASVATKSMVAVAGNDAVEPSTFVDRRLRRAGVR